MKIEPDNPKGKLDLSFKNTFMNAWIDPEGNIYEVGLAGHGDFAGEYITQDMEGKFFKEYKDWDRVTTYGSLSDYLEYLGWVRVMTWSCVPSKVIINPIPRRVIALTNKQKEALFDLCMKYDSDIYKEFYQGDK